MRGVVTDFYIARCAGCGNITAGCVDKIEYLSETAKDVRRWRKEGRIVEKITSDNGLTLQRCSCKKAKP
jgi:hypothetical protein